MIGPRDQPLRFNVPVNYETGQELTPRQNAHLEALSETAAGLYSAMHFAEGSAEPGEHQEHVFMSRRMTIAATYLEISLMMARRAALETR